MNPVATPALQQLRADGILGGCFKNKRTRGFANNSGTACFHAPVDQKAFSGVWRASSWPAQPQIPHSASFKTVAVGYGLSTTAMIDLAIFLRIIPASGAGRIFQTDCGHSSSLQHSRELPLSISILKHIPCYSRSFPQLHDIYSRRASSMTFTPT
jgi:hypothetical protein